MSASRLLTFEGEARAPVQGPSIEEVEAALQSIRPRGPSYFSLTDASGSYVQTAGAKARLILEYRQVRGFAFQHFVLGRAPEDSRPQSLNYSGGAIRLLTSEILTLKDALVVFRAFFVTRSIPTGYTLRDNTAMFKGDQDR
jgi:hypothetical protein